MLKRIYMATLAGADIMCIHKEELVDVSEIRFDHSVPREQRAAQVVAAVKNPYCFRVGDLGVKLEFLENTPPLQDCFAGFLQRKKSGL